MTVQQNVRLWNLCQYSLLALNRFTVQQNIRLWNLSSKVYLIMKGLQCSRMKIRLRNLCQHSFLTLNRFTVQQKIRLWNLSRQSFLTLGAVAIITLPSFSAPLPHSCFKYSVLYIIYTNFPFFALNFKWESFKRLIPLNICTEFGGHWTQN